MGDLIRKLFSEIRLMGDNYFFDLIREEGHAIGLEEGRKEGARTELRRGIVLVLRIFEVGLARCRKD